MDTGSHAVICRDIAQFDLIAEKAAARGLNIVSYGESENADLRLLSYENGVALVAVGEEQLSLRLKTAGRHMVLNALAVLAVACIEKLPPVSYTHLTLPTILLV